MELIWFMLGFAALPIGVLVVGFLVLRREPDLRAWVRYLWVVGLAVIAWFILVMMQGRLDAPPSPESANLEIVFSLLLVLSLPGIVVVGGFWALIGRAATLERQTRMHRRRESF
ncbi:hypothetical protein E8P82_09715 [Arthrobacter echini]|uniref:Uncharacterized protein n=1 Tax=Arthrobacter echini TaxID=1529066 RepID=A0A4S5E4D4_9MICC|nr:hypothetical protein [Arthrobacter echini]THJ66262.1 hypothetical protein E8P82_09715 [Arthrobacter echini]